MVARHSGLRTRSCPCPESTYRGKEPTRTAQLVQALADRFITQPSAPHEQPSQAQVRRARDEVKELVGSKQRTPLECGEKVARVGDKSVAAAMTPGARCEDALAFARGIGLLPCLCSCAGNRIGAELSDGPGDALDPGSSSTGGGGGPAGTGSVGDNGPLVPFDVVDKDTSLRKVKYLMTGGVPTSEEFAGYKKDSSLLRAYVAAWMKTEAYRSILQAFFANQFQQSQMNGDNLRALYYGLQPNDPVYANLMESFARTVMALIDEGRPFAEVMTTRRHMLTTQLMVYYAYSDTARVSDSGEVRVPWYSGNDKQGPIFRNSGGPVNLADIANPNSANYLTFYLPGLAKSGLHYASPQTGASAISQCRSIDPMVWYSSRVYGYSSESVHPIYYWLSGGGILFVLPDGNSNPGSSRIYCTTPDDGPNYFKPNDGNDWRMVEIRQPKSGERRREMFDLDNIRNSNLLLMDGARVSFFSTPAFASQWSFNESNSGRAAVNQTLIAALGRQIDGSDVLPLSSPTAVDPNHSADAACFACHQTLDPLRQYLRQSYTLTYSPQQDSKQAQIPAHFSISWFQRRRSGRRRTRRCARRPPRTGVGVDDKGVQLGQQQHLRKRRPRNTAHCRPVQSEQLQLQYAHARGFQLAARHLRCSHLHRSSKRPGGHDRSP